MKYLEIALCEVAWEHLGLDVASISARAALAGLAVVVSFAAVAKLGFGDICTVFAQNWPARVG